MKHLFMRTVAFCLVLGMLMGTLPVSYGVGASAPAEESKAHLDTFVAIYNVAYSVVMTEEVYIYPSSTGMGEDKRMAAAATLDNGMLTTEATNVALFRLQTDEAGITSFITSDGKYLEADGNNLRFVDAPNANTEFVLEVAEDGYYIRLANFLYNGTRAQYIEYYPSVHAYDIYSMTFDTTMFVFNFYPVEGACIHSWDEGQTLISASCATKGVVRYICTLCGLTKTVDIPALGHSWNEGETVATPNCTTEGAVLYTCTVCKGTKRESIAALGHSWDSGSLITDATCASSGIMSYTCTLCSETETQLIPATGKHSYQNAFCTVCNASEEIAYGSFALSKELKDGDRVIIVCAAKNMALAGTYDGFYNKAIAVTPVDGMIAYPPAEIIWRVNEVEGGYTFSYEGQTIGLEEQFSSMSPEGVFNIWKKQDAATEGAFYLFNEDRSRYMEYYEARGCWDAYILKPDTEELFALNFYVDFGSCMHLWDEGEVITPATCTAEGTMLYTCSFCESTKIEAIAVIEHSWNEGEISTPPTCTEEGIMTYTCTLCGDTKNESIPATGHKSTDWYVSLVPTCTEEGRRVKECRICGAQTDSEAVAPTGHSFAHHICIYCDTEETVKGQCGPELFWTLQLNSGLLSIQGEGDMYSFMDVSPWESYGGRIFRVQLPDGITSIGSYAFDHCSFLEEVEIPASVTRIEEGAFRMCSSLRAVTVRNGQCSLPEKLFALADLANLRLYGQPNSTLEEHAEAEGLRFLPACDCVGGRGVVMELTQPTCTLAGSISYHCDLCGFRAEKEGQPSPGHRYSYVSEGMNHFAYCVCGDRRWEGHSFTDGQCICGLNQNILLQHTLNLASDISISYAVKQEMLQGYDSFYLTCSVPNYEGNQLTGMRSLSIQPVERGSYYYFTLEGLTAVNMNDVIEATLYMQKDGQLCFSSKDSYSIATYAYAQLGKAAAGQKLKILCANLLRYGAATQVYKGYRTDALADAGLTAEHKGYLTDLNAVTFGNNNTILEDLPNPRVQWVGKSLDLQSKVGVKFVVGVPMPTKSEGPLILHVSYKSIDGKTVTVTLSDPEFYDEDKGYFAFTFDGLMAAELRTPLTVAAYKNGSQVSQSLIYSPDTYGNGKTGALLTLCQALFAYSDAAKSYFTS